MSRLNWQKWPIPETVNPTTHTDWCVPVPDDPAHRAAFLGALQKLGSALQWADDPGHTAIEAAEVWRKIIDDLKKCHDDTKTKFVAIETEDYVSVCQQLRFHDGKLQGLCGVDCDTNEPQWEDICGQGDDDTGDSQPGPTPRPDPGKQKCYTVTLKGRDQWKLPFSVRDGDIVTITGVDGAWSDGTASWYCGDGNSYILGACAGFGQDTDGGDPEPSLYHMSVIFSVGSTYNDGYNTTTTIPDGTGNQELTLQANDGSLSDNQGSVTLKICVENGTVAPTEGWCKTFDFTASNGGWSALTDGISTVGVWSAGVGWVDSGDPSAVGMQLFCPDAPPTTIFTRFVMRMDAVTSGDPSPRAYAADQDGAGDLGGGTIAALQVYDDTFTVPYTGTRILTVYGTGGPDPSLYAITSITLYGTGPNPYGANNC